MNVAQLKLTPGTWLFSNCADMPSEKNCRLVMMAPADQKEDLMAAGVAHMVTSHGHKRGEAEKMIAEHPELFHTITVPEEVTA